MKVNHRSNVSTSSSEGKITIPTNKHLLAKKNDKLFVMNDLQFIAKCLLKNEDYLEEIRSIERLINSPDLESIMDNVNDFNISLSEYGRKYDVVVIDHVGVKSAKIRPLTQTDLDDFNRYADVKIVTLEKNKKPILPVCPTVEYDPLLRETCTTLSKLSVSGKKKHGPTSGKTLKEQNRRKAQKQTLHIEAQLSELSFEGMERKADVKRIQIVRKESIVHDIKAVKARTKMEKALFRAAFLRRRQNKREDRIAHRIKNKEQELPVSEGGFEEEDFKFAGEVAWSALEIAAGKHVRCLISYLTLMYNATDWSARYHASNLYITLVCGEAGVQNTLSAIFDVFHKLYKYDLEEWSAAMQPRYIENNIGGEVESEGRSIDASLDYSTSFITGPLVEGLRNMFLALAGVTLFGVNFGSVIHRLFGNGKARSLSIAEFVVHFLEALKKLAHVGQALANGVPFAEAIVSNDPALQARENLHGLIASRDLVSFGLAEPGRIDIKAYMRDLNENIAFLEKINKDLSPTSKDKKKGNAVLIQAKTVQQEWKRRIRGQTRVAPIGVILVGPSSIGKGHLLPYTCKIHSNCKGRKFDPSHMYTRVKDSEYWDGYDIHATPYIHYSEMASIHNELAAKGLDMQSNEITSLIDSIPYCLNTAFGDKGTMYAGPDMVVGDTNVPDLNLDWIVNYPVAYKRRFIFVEPTVDEEFRKPNSVSLDPAKSIAAGGHILDRYRFKVYTYVQQHSKDRHGREHVLARNVDLAGYTALMTKLFTDHIVKGENIRTQMDDVPLYFPNGYTADIKPANAVRHPANYVPLPKADDWEFDTDSDTDEPFSDIGGIKDDYSIGVGCVRQRVKTEGGQSSKSYIPNPVDQAFSHIELPDVSVVLDVVWTDYVLYFLSLIWTFVCAFGMSVILKLIQVSESTWYTMNPLRFVMMFSLIYFNLFPLWTLPLAFVNERVMLSKALDVLLDRLEMRVSLGYEARCSKIKHFVFGSACNVVKTLNNKYVISIGLALSLATIYFAGRKNKKISEANVELPKSLDCGSKSAKIPNKVKENIWNDQHNYDHVICDVPVHRGPPTQLLPAVASNVVHLRVKHEGETTGEVYALGVYANFAIIPKHIFRNSEVVTILVEPNSDHLNEDVWLSFLFRVSEAINVCDDVVLLQIPNKRFRDLRKHFTNQKPIHRTMGVQSMTDADLNIGFHDDTLPIKDKFKGEIRVNQFLDYEVKHKGGDCGLPVIAQLAQGSSIVGFHLAGENGSDKAYGNWIMKDDVVRSCEEMIKFALFVPNSQAGETEGKMIGEALRNLQSPVPKSLVCYESLPGIQYYGKVEGPVILPTKSRIVETPFHKDIKDYFSNVCLESYPEMGTPMMRSTCKDGNYINPLNIAMVKLGQSKKVLDTKILKQVVDIISKHIIDGLTDRGITERSPLTVEEAVNGVDDDPFIKRINASTSGGFGFPGIKSQYIPLSDDGVKRYTVEELTEQVLLMLQTYSEGRSCHPVFSAKLKDEIRTMVKILAGNTRVFYMSPTDFLIVSRMFLAPFYSLMVQHGDLFSAAIGIDMHAEAHDLYKELEAFSTDILLGDYGAYDLVMPHGVGEAVNAVIMRVLRHLGYTEEALRVTNGILTDNLFPYIEVLKDIFCVPNLQPSGKYGTAEDNSMRGLVILVYHWVYGGYEGDFYDNVLAKLYGDDVLASCKNKNFNALSHAKFCNEVLGMKFTDGNKNVIVDPYTDLADSDFLKRHFKYDKNFDRIVAYLPVATFVKALCWRMPSNVLTELEQILACCESMLWEYALYDSHNYDRFYSLIKSLLRKHYKLTYDYLDDKLPTLAKIIHSINQRSLDTSADEPNSVLGFTSETVFSDVSTEGGEAKSDLEDSSYSSVSKIIWTTKSNSTQALHNELSALTKEVRSSPFYDSVFNTDKTVAEAMHDDRNKIPDTYRKQIQRLFDVKATLMSDRDYMTSAQRVTRDEKSRNTISESASDTPRVVWTRDFDSRSSWHKEMRSLWEDILSDPLYDMIFNTGKTVYETLHDSNSRIPDDYRKKIQRFFDLKSTLELDRDYMARAQVLSLDVFTEAGEVEGTGDLHSGAVEASAVRNEENVEDVDGRGEAQTVAGESIYPDAGIETNLSIEDFLSRPVAIANFILLVGATTTTKFPIWRLWCLIPAIRSKLRNYTNFKGNLKVKVVVSGMPFHSGKVLIAYKPYGSSNLALLSLESGVSVDPAMTPLLINYLSQSIGSSVMDVKANEPLEMEIPFISTKPFFRLYNSSPTAISGFTPYDDFDKAGDLHFVSINPIGATSPGPSAVRVQIYVSAHDVTLSAATATIQEIFTEAGEVESIGSSNDERRTGPIERISSAAVSVSKALTQIPFIKPYALASSIVFSGVKSLSSLMGWSKPTIVSSPLRVKNEPWQNGAQCIGYDTGKPLTIDPLQEITVDPSVCGVTTDDTNLKWIAQKMSYLTTFVWSAGAAPFTPMFQSKVHPCLGTYVNSGGRVYFQPTAMMFAAQPFAHWNGPIKIRLEFVCSSFHRGKVGVWYEPNLNQSAIITPNLNIIKNNIVMVDLSQTQTLDLVINWSRPRLWSKCESVYNQSYGSDYVNDRPTFSNGMFIVAPFTSLQSPNNSDIQVNVYVGSPDLGLNYLTDQNMPTRRDINIAAARSMEPAHTEAGEITESESVSSMELNKSSANLDMSCTHHFGERPTTFNLLLKRFIHSASYELDTVGGFPAAGRCHDRNLPVNVLPFGASIPSGQFDLFSYLYYAYLGVRGGVNKRLHVYGVTSRDTCQVKVTNVISSPAAPIGAIRVLRPAQSFMAGTTTFLPGTNGGFEVRIPFYSNNLFLKSFSNDFIGDNNPDEMDTAWNKSAIYEVDLIPGASSVRLQIETAASCDFGFMRFEGAPYFVLP